MLPLRSLEEQQQQAKPSTAVSEPPSVTAAAPYVDSPRKVNICAVCGSKYFASADASVIICSKYWGKMSLLVLCWVGAFAPVSPSISVLLGSVPVAGLWVFDLGLCSSCVLTGRCLYFGFYT